MQRISIFGDVGLSVTVDGVKAQLEQLERSQPVTVEINSDGGSVSEAIAIYNLLRTWPAGVDVEIIGWALSAATIIAMAGRTIRAHETSLLMVHAPWVSTSGNSSDLRERADMLDQVAATMRSAYARTRQPAKVIDSWLDGADHWMTADEALALGLIDEIITATERAAAQVDVRACRFPVPAPLQQRIFAMPNPTLPNEADIRAAALRADQSRRSEIRAKFAPMLFQTGMAELQRECEDDPACTPLAAGERILAKMARSMGPVSGHYVPPDNENEGRMQSFRAAATDALLIRAGIRPAEPHPAVRDVASMSVVAMAERILSMQGRSVAGMSRDGVINAAMTTSDFPLLLANVTGKSLRAGYDLAAFTPAGWTSERIVNDFKQQSLVALSEAPSLLEVKEGAEYRHGAMDESDSKFQVSPHGRLVRISRQALINDDTDAFTRIPQSMGQSARRLEMDKVYSLLTSNPVLSDSVALFHATHGNLSAAAVPSLASLGAARAAMRKQKGIAKLDFIDPQPRYLIVPVELETSCEQLLSSLVDPSKSNETPNVEWIRGLTLVADPRLDQVSTSQWYLASAPQQVEGIVRAYLDGEQRPYLEQQQGFEIDALTFKVRLDLAVGVVDYRALHRNG